jgi:hypothetical protein
LNPMQWARTAMRRRRPAPVIYLHIGRNKVGSTTLQDFFLDRRAELASGGVEYFLFGHMKDSVPGVPGFAHQLELADYARTATDRAVLISNEFMFGWPEEFTRAVVDGLKGFDTRVIAYIRPYDAWLASSYAWDARIGTNKRDFDAYFDWMRPRVSALPYLEAWAEGLGWDKVRVRAVDGQGLRWSDLVPDCLGALGLDRHLGVGAPVSNQACHWLTTELVRSLIDRNGDEAWDEATLQTVLDVCTLFETCLAASTSPVPGVQYLTPAQSRDLAELYNRDVAAISRHTGFALAPQPLDRVAERAFLPSLDQVPAGVLADFAARAAAADFVQAHPEAAAMIGGLGLLSTEGEIR